MEGEFDFADMIERSSIEALQSAKAMVSRERSFKLIANGEMHCCLVVKDRRRLPQNSLTRSEKVNRAIRVVCAPSVNIPVDPDVDCFDTEDKIVNLEAEFRRKFKEVATMISRRPLDSAL